MAWSPANYDVISRNHSNCSSLNLSQNVREVLMFYPLGKNWKKTSWGVASTPTPGPLYVWGLIHALSRVLSKSKNFPSLKTRLKLFPNFNRHHLTTHINMSTSFFFFIYFFFLWADSSWSHCLHFCSVAFKLTHRRCSRIYRLGAKIIRAA